MDIRSRKKQEKVKQEHSEPRQASGLRINPIPLIGFGLILLFALILHLWGSNGAKNTDATASVVTPEIFPVED